ncbi:MAG: ABC transporter permease subunit [Blastochloris sp.]|jgi:ABC-type transport system involved in multi-copper enzyme maturation permease subunit|nr:ABC transporter permease subunit [Blastochloris sp.]
MKGSLLRLVTIAQNTLTEALRQRVLNVIFLSGLIMVGGSFFLTNLTFQEEFKFLKDLGYAAISITGTLVALMGAAQLIPAEIERRTLHTLLSKPVHRFEFVLGKYLGLIALITIMLGIMSLMFGAVLYVKEQIVLAGLQGVAESEQGRQVIASVLAQSRDPQLLQALALIWAKLAVITAISVFFSTIATSTIFIVCTTLVVYFIGHLQSVARQVWLQDMHTASFLKNSFLAMVAFLIPDFQTYNLIDEIIAGNNIRWGSTLEILTYSVIYVGVALVTASLIFEDREL